MAASKIALFIDADNISAKNGRQIIETLQERGDIFIRRIYGNWEKTTLHGWNSCILDFSLKPVQQNDFVTGKNATDMSLTIDAMDVLHEGKADTFALVSNDSDFTPLVIRLREGGVNIIGMGMGHASNAFRAACTEFIELDANPKSDADIETSAPIVKPPEVKISTAAQNTKTPTQISLFDEDSMPPEKILNPKVVPIDEGNKIVDAAKVKQLHDALAEIFKSNAESDGYVSLSTTGTLIGQKNLSIKGSGHSSLNKFIAAFPDRYEIIFREMHNYYYRCIDVNQNPPKVTENTKVKQLHVALEEIAKNNAEPDGYVLLSTAGSSISQNNLSIKDSGYSSLSKFIKAFPNRYEFITRDISKDCYRCVNVKPPKNSDKAKLEQLHAALKESAERHKDSDGFSLLNYAGQTLKSKSFGFGVKDFGFNQLRDFVSAFPNRYEILSDDCGQKFRYRCK
ncbi:MAG: NYN domain-containing protein [Selenomonadaceae bacterium]|nr:NYN domain-containing protein [Selenomonadaceae bacterium]